MLVGPSRFCRATYAGNGISIERDFDAVLPSADAVVLLRIQRERFADYRSRIESTSRPTGSTTGDLRAAARRHRHASRPV